WYWGCGNNRKGVRRCLTKTRNERGNGSDYTDPRDWPAAGNFEALQRQPTRPDATTTEHNVAAFLIPLVAGGALAAHNPKLGMAAGSGTLAVAVIFKKGWVWWVLGIVILALALFFYWNKKHEEGSQPGNANEKA